MFVLFGNNWEDLMFDGRVQTEKKINILFDEVARQYHLIVNILGSLERL